MATAQILVLKTRAQRPSFNWPGVATLLGIALVWEIAVDTGLLKFQFLPAPSEILRAFWQVLLSGELLADTVHTLMVVLVGWVIGTAIGAIVGLWLGVSSVARRFAQATTEFFRAAPGIAFVPVIVLIFGFTLTSEIVTVTYVSIWPVLVNATAGALAVSTVHRETQLTLNLSTFDSMRKIVIPTALPRIVIGTKLALTGALALAVVTEMMANPKGVGYAIVYYQQALEPALMMVFIVWIGVLGILLNVAFDYLTGRLSSVKASRAGQL